MERREPIIEEEPPEPEPQPETASAGGVRPPGRVGGGLRDHEGGDEPPTRPGRPHWSDPGRFRTPIEDLNLSMRAYNCLRRYGLLTVGQIVRKSEEELLSIRNLGRRSYDELRERMDEFGILDAAHSLPVIVADAGAKADPSPPDVSRMPIEDLNLPMRTYSILRRANLRSLDQLRKAGEQRLRFLLGDVAYLELQGRLDQLP